MLVRRYSPSDPKMDEPWCTYLVRYEGPAEDPHAWLAHYLAHHPVLMLRLPGIRELEVYHATKGAIAAIEKAGGSIKVLKPSAEPAAK